MKRKHEEKVRISIYSMVLLIVLGVAMPTQAQKKKAKEPKESSRTYVVDDESCGCELYFIDGIQTTQNGHLFGFKREDGTVIVEPKYFFVDRFHGDYCIVYDSLYRCGMIDREGREVVPVKYEDISYPTEGMIRVKANELYGFYDTSGRLVIDCQYHAASGFNEGMAVASFEIDSLTLLYGFIDKKNKVVLPAEYEYAFSFQEGYAVVKQYDRYGVIDRQGRTCLPCKYLEVSGMKDGTFLAVDASSEQIALFNNKFERMTDFKYDQVISYSEGYYLMAKNGKRGLLNRKGKEQYGWYDDMSGFIEGYSYVRNGDKWGIMNKKGKLILPIEYDNSGYKSMEYIFSDGLAMIEKDGKYGFCDTKGKIVIPTIYQNALQCTEGLIPVKRDGMWGYIDKSGQDAMAFIFDQTSYFEWGRAEVVYKGTEYKINPRGECVKACKTFPKRKIWLKD